jgi:RNA-binding protein
LTVADNGLTEGVLAELERALADHELIKIKLNILDRESRLAHIAELCKVGKADLVQVIGKMALVYRKNFSVNKQLSNVHRFK